MTLQQLLTQQAKARAELQALARIAPACFDRHGKPIVAVTPPPTL